MFRQEQIVEITFEEHTKRIHRFIKFNLVQCLIFSYINDHEYIQRLFSNYAIDLMSNCAQINYRSVTSKMIKRLRRYDLDDEDDDDPIEERDPS